jgi:hypothetical protein
MLLFDIGENLLWVNTYNPFRLTGGGEGGYSQNSIFCITTEIKKALKLEKTLIARKNRCCNIFCVYKLLHCIKFRYFGSLGCFGLELVSIFLQWS